MAPSFVRSRRRSATCRISPKRGFSSRTSPACSRTWRNVDAQPDAARLATTLEQRGRTPAQTRLRRRFLRFVPVRKEGKLPGQKIAQSYALEYGSAVLEIHKDAIRPGQAVVIVDDLLATGGTARTTARLVQQLGGKVVGISFLIELKFLKGADNLSGYNVVSHLKF